jgi:hypothetical protein
MFLTRGGIYELHEQKIPSRGKICVSYYCVFLFLADIRWYIIALGAFCRRDVCVYGYDYGQNLSRFGDFWDEMFRF